MVLDLSSDVERDIYYCGSYRRWVTSRFEAETAPGNTVVDIGANVGEYVLRAAQRTQSHGQVIGLEPSSQCFRKLQRNVAINEFNNIRIDNVALGDFNGDATLHLNPATSLNQAQSSLGRFGHHKSDQKVQCRKLDDYLAESAIDSVDMIKVDAQGGEMAVLRGAKSTIERCRPTIIFRTGDLLGANFGERSTSAQKFLLERDYVLYEIMFHTGKLRCISYASQVEDATFIATTRDPVSM